MRVKICGITSPEDAAAAVEAGADAIGLVFYAASRRAVSPDEAAKIAAAISPLVMTVGLFVNAPTETVLSTLERVPLNLLQFHGDESPEYCREFHRPYLKALPVTDSEELRRSMDSYPEARGFLLDTAAAGQFGGTGKTFDWALVPSDSPRPLVLAGGLGPDNVAAAISAVGPAAVDVSSGVESAPGIKDPLKMQKFVAAARAAFEESAI
ncbi:MAG: phosphoribosylanthranilate isomerase [Halieaceae bacterium]|nr:phosphoribosylanthranilate isomerase [Halieaceae bacterium]